MECENSSRQAVGWKVHKQVKFLEENIPTSGEDRLKARATSFLLNFPRGYNVYITVARRDHNFGILYYKNTSKRV